MAKVVTEPNTYSFTGNPVIVGIETELTDIVHLEIYLPNDKILSLFGYSLPAADKYIAEFDISNILASFIDIDISKKETDAIVTVLDNYFLPYKLGVEDWTSDTYFAIDGGVSDSEILELADMELDMFSYRLNNPTQQFLFTTRTDNEHICLSELELFPFVFIHPGTPITFISNSGKNITTPARAKGTPCLMDISVLRNTFFDLYKELPTYISVNPNNSISFDITIKPARITENSYALRFKNSLGGFEQIEITGELTYKPKMKDVEKYQEYNSIKTFEYRRQRVPLSDIYSLNSGYKSENELLHLLDAICSERVYLIDSAGRLKRCIITIEDGAIPDRITVPVSIQMTLEFVNKNNYLTPKLNNIIPGAWILDTGLWNDLARWIDSKQWID